MHSIFHMQVLVLMPPMLGKHSSPPLQSVRPLLDGTTHLKKEITAVSEVRTHAVKPPDIKLIKSIIKLKAGSLDHSDMTAFE